MKVSNEVKGLGLAFLLGLALCGVVFLVAGCEPPVEVANKPCWWTFSEENYQSGPPDHKTCQTFDAGVDQ